MTKQSVFSFRSEIWEYPGPAVWYFISLPEAVTDDIDDWFGHRAAGFGSIRVEVTIGSSVWRTSVFPDSKRGTYILPVKKAVRKANGLVDGSTTEVTLEVVLD